MALTPTDNEAFFREVDEDLRRDRVAGLARRWGRPALIAIGVLLVALAGFLWWQSYRAKQADAAAERYTSVLNDLDTGKAAGNDPRLAAIAGSSNGAYQALARMTQAGLAAQLNAAKGAAAYQAIAADGNMPQPMRDLALIRATTLELDTLPPQQVVDRLKPLVVPGAPWFGSAGELTGLAYLKMNRRDLAGPLFARIVRDETAPASLRGRAAAIATSLGQKIAPIAATASKG